jgi:hypothetical protein
MNRLVSYAMDFASFLIYSLPEKQRKGIKSIILFGSVARGDHGKESDIDIFIDTVHGIGIENRIKGLEKDFFESVRYREHWKMLGVENRFRVITGKLEKWPDLRVSIISNGIVLYGRYKGASEKKNLKTLFYWGSLKDETKRVHLDKKLFGFTYKDKSYKGIVHSYGGEKLGPRTILVPTEHHRKVLEIFRKMKIPVKILEVSA